MGEIKAALPALTDEELARVETGEAEIRRGEFVTLDDLRHRLEL